MSDDVKYMAADLRGWRNVAWGEGEFDEFLRSVADALEALTKEMHSRELHHFETEKLLVEAGIDPDALEASVQAPAVDREALARVLHSTCGCYDWNPGDTNDTQYDDMAERIIASGILQDAAVLEREAEARGLEKAADILSPGPMTVGHYSQTAEHLRARAQQVREGDR